MMSKRQERKLLSIVTKLRIEDNKRQVLRNMRSMIANCSNRERRIRYIRIFRKFRDL